MVSLIGGGTGDAELITVKGLKRIQEADCILYDRLVPADLLREAKDGCELIYVGKAQNHHTMRQEEINSLLIEKAKQYANVVRLKGGDPYVFGRGGEEALALLEHEVEVEVVSGISSCIAGPAFAGIPITHRGIARGFHVVTAHGQNNECAEIDYDAMAKGTETCVFLMGLSNVKEIVHRLIEAGMDKNMPSAVISNATTPEQKTCTAPLFQLPSEVEREKLVSPAILIVGKVVALRKQLNFFEQKKLFGKQYLVTKIGDAKSKITELLEEQGAVVTELQTGTIQNRKKNLTKEELKKVDWLIFTSAKGVCAFFENLENSKLDTRSLWHCNIAAVGGKTSEELKKYGIRADLCPRQENAKALAELLVTKITSETVIWHIRAKEADSALRETLNGRCLYKEQVLYENKQVLSGGEKEKLLQETVDGIFFTCASSVKRFFGEEKNTIGEKCRFYTIGEKTTEALKIYGIKNIVQAQTPSFEAIVESLLEEEKKRRK